MAQLSAAKINNWHPSINQSTNQNLYLSWEQWRPGKLTAVLRCCLKNYFAVLKSIGSENKPHILYTVDEFETRIPVTVDINDYDFNNHLSCFNAS